MASKRKNPSSIPRVLDGTYFQPQEIQSDGSLQALCMTCKKLVSGYVRPTSNFITHLKSNHLDVYQEYESMSKNKVPRLEKGQPTLPFSKVPKPVVSLSDNDRLLIHFVVKTMQPISIVDDPSFRAMINGFNPNVHIPCAKTFRGKIDMLYHERVGLLQKKLSLVKHVCITADIWSSHRRSFLGVTAHWITTEKNTFIRRSVMLSLARFPGTHSYDRIAEMLQLVMTLFEIEDKVDFVVTDNGSNFVKAFEQFSLPEDLIFLSEGCVPSTDESMSEVEMDEHADDLRVEFPENGDGIFLPTHLRCATHTTHLVAKEEPSMKSPEGKDMGKRTMRSSMAKCNAIWNKANRSVKFAEDVKDTTEKSVVSPICTRWNSTYNAILRILQLRNYLGNICKKAKLKDFSPREIEFLEGYKMAMEPLAWSITKLQGEHNPHSFLGYLAPACFMTISKLNAIISGDNNNAYARTIAFELKQRFYERFKAILEYDVARAKSEIFASICIPEFKLDWIPTVRHEQIKQLFVAECVKLCGQQASGGHSSKISKQSNPVSEWDAIKVAKSTCSVETKITHPAAEIELLQYLRDDEESLESILKYPSIHAMFLKYNTPLPSSAPAERLFSYAGMILRPNRSCLSDDLFEQMCFLKLYNDF